VTKQVTLIVNHFFIQNLVKSLNEGRFQSILDEDLNVTFSFKSMIPFVHYPDLALVTQTKGEIELKQTEVPRKRLIDLDGS